MASIKQEVRDLADRLPEDATWEQVQYEVYVRAAIEAGERSIAEGIVLDHEVVKARFSGR